MHNGHNKKNLFSFMPYATRLWNSLPVDHRSITSYNRFKSITKSNLLPTKLGYLIPRLLNILLNRLRSDFSALHSPHFSCRFKAWACGYHSETTLSLSDAVSFVYRYYANIFGTGKRNNRYVLS